MENQESANLMQILKGITFDGELSADEAYALAEYLNHNDAAATTWPGTELVPALAAIWGDGDINHTELQGLANLIQSIERQWEARMSPPPPRVYQLEALPDAPKKKSAEPEPPPLETISRDLSFPRAKLKFKAQSKSEPGMTYDVDLSDQSCTCADWTERRSKYPIGDFRRACKHIVWAYPKSKEITPDHLIVRALMGCYDYGFPTDGRLFMAETDSLPIVAITGDRAWVNVYVPDKAGHYQRFGYSTAERRWSYGERPYRSRRIVDWVLRVSGRG
jgi:hypothetical protein